MNTTKLTYRPDIDGLRAIAVLAVIANHLPEKFLASGFLGVDVFFVISGFVVSASILGQSGAGAGNFYANFLSRRVKRLMPALIASVAVVSLIILLVDPFPRNSIITGISALFGVANIALFNFELDYFSPSSTLNAFTHTWSLGVEEQFYVVFPLFIWLTYLGTKNRSLNTLAVILTLASAASLLLFLWLYQVNQVAAYYLMPTRIWELGTGALVYMYLDKLGSPRWSRVLAYASPVALIALLLCFYAPQTHGAWVMPIAVFLTAVLLASSTHTASSKLLALRPMVYVGKISYSLYLWHWPIISLAPLILPSSWRFSVIYLVAMGVASVLSFHVIEKPLRKANWSRRKVRDIGLGFACSAVLSGVLLSAMMYKESATEQSVAALYPEDFLPILYSGLPYITCVIDDKRPMTPETFDHCTIPPSRAGAPTIWAMGDSHIGHLQGLLYSLHDILGVGIHSVTTPGKEFPNTQGVEYPPRLKIFERVLENLKSGDIVLISRLYLLRLEDGAPKAGVPAWVERVSSLARDLAERDVTLVVTGPAPIFFFEDIRECDIKDRAFCSVERSKIAPSVEAVMKQLVTMKNQNSNVIVFDTFDFLCPAQEQRCYPDDGIRFLYRNRDHFNSFGSQLLTEPFSNLLRSSGAL